MSTNDGCNFWMREQQQDRQCASLKNTLLIMFKKTDK